MFLATAVARREEIKPTAKPNLKKWRGGAQQRAQPRPRNAAELGPRREFKACTHKCRGGRCPLSVAKRTLQECAAMSAYGPKRTFRLPQ
jgi:hypothetical protein